MPKWPAKFGGPGWTPTQHYIWEQETAKANIPFDIPFGLGMLAPILMGYGNEEQQERFLPAIRERTVNWCQGYSEPGAGSDLANLKTKAVLSEDGTYYTVNGCCRSHQNCSLSPFFHYWAKSVNNLHISISVLHLAITS